MWRLNIKPNQRLSIQGIFPVVVSVYRGPRAVQAGMVSSGWTLGDSAPEQRARKTGAWERVPCWGRFQLRKAILSISLCGEDTVQFSHLRRLCQRGKLHFAAQASWLVRHVRSVQGALREAGPSLNFWHLYQFYDLLICFAHWVSLQGEGSRPENRESKKQMCLEPGPNINWKYQRQG